MQQKEKMKFDYLIKIVKTRTLNKTAILYGYSMKKNI